MKLNEIMRTSNYGRFLQQETCEDIFDDQKIEIRESNLCARSLVGDACKGDSGGGLIVEIGR